MCILPWHLLLWWAKSRLTGLSEQACDDWVLATGQPGADYAESLLDLPPGKQMAFVPAVVGSKKGLAGRVRRILKDSCGNPRTGAAWAVAVSIAAVCVVAGISFAQTRPAKPQAPSEPESAVVPSDDGYPLTEIGKDQVVQKFFKLTHYSPSDMSRIVGPLLSDIGHISADEDTRTLSAIDTAENLMRIEKVIAHFDVRGAERVVTEIFHVYNGDPSDIVQMIVRVLRYPVDKRPLTDAPTSAVTVIGPSGQPVVLIPQQRYKWIIAKASSEDMKKIAELIEKLDKKESKVVREYESVKVRDADAREVAERLNEAIQQMPGTELQQGVLFQPLLRARQIIIFGRKDLREMAKKLIAEMDIPSGLFETRVFKLKYAVADKVKENLEDLYEQEAGYSYSSGGYSRRPRNVETSEMVRIIAFPTMRQVTVITSPENMRKIAEQIAEWDVPLDLDQIKPRIITLKNSDPVQMHDLLKRLFAGEGGGEVNIYDVIFGKDAEEKRKTVGPLNRQLTFEEVPGTKKIIVISSFPEAYDVVEELILELDKQKMAAKDVKQIREWIAKLQSEGRLKRSNISGVRILIEINALTMDVGLLKGLSLDAISVGGSMSWSEYCADDSVKLASFMLDQPAVDLLLGTAMENEDAKMLISQRMFVKDGEEVRAFSGQDIPFISGYSEPSEPSEKPTPGIKYMEVGTSIQIRAQLRPDKARVYLRVESSTTRIRGFKERTYMDRYTHMVPQRESFRSGMMHIVPLGKTLLIGQRISKSSRPTLADMPLVEKGLPDETSPRELEILLTLAKPTVSRK